MKEINIWRENVFFNRHMYTYNVNSEIVHQKIILDWEVEMELPSPQN